LAANLCKVETDITDGKNHSLQSDN